LRGLFDAAALTPAEAHPVTFASVEIVPGSRKAVCLADLGRDGVAGIFAVALPSAVAVLRKR